MDIYDHIRFEESDEVVLLEYITDNDINIAIAAAESRYATGPVLDIAAHDKDRKVRLAALNNPNISKRTLMFLTGDSDAEIAQKASEKLR